jgi:hypothetical protein
MEQSTSASVSEFRRPRRLIIAFIVVVIISGVALATHVWNANTGLTMPSTGSVTVTGYGDSSPANPSTQPHSIILTKSQAATLRGQISSIPTLSLSTSSLSCQENETAFKIVVTSVQSSPSVTWTARAQLCPAPGILYVRGNRTGGSDIVRYCTLKRLILSFFPKGTVNGTRSGLRFC